MGEGFAAEEHIGQIDAQQGVDVLPEPGQLFSQPQIPVEANEIFTRFHLKHFGGEKVLMLMEPQEREDAFFVYENGFMEKKSGYYIFYEKNPRMQAYMIEKNDELHTETEEKCEDKAVKNFRRIITDKKQDAEERASVFYPL